MGDQHSLEMKADVDQLVDLLNEHPVVSIWGANGLGKTTMARKVYSHPRVGGRFDAFAWVSLTKDDHVHNILVNMRDQLRSGAQSRGVLQRRGAEEEQKSGFLNSFLRFFKSETSVVENGRNDLEERFEGLEEILRQKKCFIVFDGVFGNAQWQQIKSAVRFDGTDTRVLITTQHEDTIGDEGVSHELRRLTQAQGWELLQKYVYHPLPFV